MKGKPGSSSGFSFKPGSSSGSSSGSIVKARPSFESSSSSSVKSPYNIFSLYPINSSKVPDVVNPKVMPDVVNPKVMQKQITKLTPLQNLELQKYLISKGSNQTPRITRGIIEPLQPTKIKNVFNFLTRKNINKFPTISATKLLNESNKNAQIGNITLKEINPATLESVMTRAALLHSNKNKNYYGKINQLQNEINKVKQKEYKAYADAEAIAKLKGYLSNSNTSPKTPEQKDADSYNIIDYLTKKDRFNMLTDDVIEKIQAIKNKNLPKKDQIIKLTGLIIQEDENGRIKSFFNPEMTEKIIKHFAESSPERVNEIFKQTYNILYPPPPPISPR